MKIPGLKTTRRASRWLRSRIIPGALILGYHRIAEALSDPYFICVSPRNFAEQLEVLRQFAAPIQLQHVAKAIRGGHLPARAVALTFDDGYKDQLYQAMPLLAKHEIPATVFITTGYLGREFWWQELEQIVASSVTLPNRLCLAMNGNSFHWTSRDYGTASHDGSVRRQLLLKLYDRMLRLTHEQRDKALIQLREWTGTDSCHGGPGSALSTDEVVQLASNELIEIGAHSVTHPFLDRLPPAAQRLEIHQSKEVLEKLLGRSLAGFSYPNGAASQHTRAIVEDAGFAFACASTSDVTSHGSDRFYLPRFWIPNWDGETFARWLLRWLS